MAVIRAASRGDGVSRPATLHHSEFPVDRIATQRERSVSVCLPARDEVSTIGPILSHLMPLVESGVVDQVAVLDDSADGTADVARAHGAEVYSQSHLRPEFGPVRGKGDAMWRALSVLRGEVVCFLDADSELFDEHFVCGLVGATTCEPDIVFAKGFYRRPFRHHGVVMPEGGGRVTELMARPLLRFFYPELAGFLQPLAGEMAARRELLMSLPFVTGYGVDVALLIDAWRREGLGRLAQIDLEVRQNKHKPLPELGPMADAVLAAVLSRVVREGRLGAPAERGFLLPFSNGGAPFAIQIEERPPLFDMASSA